MDLILGFLLLNQTFSVQVADDDDVYSQSWSRKAGPLMTSNTPRDPALSPEVNSINILNNLLVSPLTAPMMHYKP